jgi:hypothetical protein
VCRPKSRIETGGGPELDQRIRVPFPLLQDDAEVVSDESAVAAVPNDAAKSCFGGVELTRRQSRDSF